MVEFIKDTDIKQNWKYSLEEFTVILPTESLDIPKDKVRGISIENNYEEDLFPVMKASMVLEPSVYKKIVKNKNDVKLKMRLQKFYTEEGSEEKSMMRDSINTMFSLLLDDDFLDPDRQLQVNTENNTEEKKNDENSIESAGNNQTEFPLYKLETMDAMRVTINDVLTNQTMIGAIVYIAEKSKMAPNSMIISPLENNQVYEEILLPPQTALSTLQYIDSQYGFYKAGSIIFFGIDRPYILNYRGGCTAYEKDEIKETCILIPDRGGKFGSLECCIEKPDEKTKKYLVVKSTNVDMKNNSISNDMLEGNSATIVNTNTGSIISASGETSQRGTGNSKIINTNTSNKWIGETYAIQKSADSAVATVACGNFDIDMFTPNKKFSFIFEDTMNGEKYKGTYILISSIFKFTKNGNDFTLDGNMTFKRPSTNTNVSSEEM